MKRTERPTVLAKWGYDQLTFIYAAPRRGYSLIFFGNTEFYGLDLPLTDHRPALKIVQLSSVLAQKQVYIQ